MMFAYFRNNDKSASCSSTIQSRIVVANDNLTRACDEGLFATQCTPVVISNELSKKIISNWIRHPKSEIVIYGLGTEARK
jgi:hypothetical protein